ncbi:hypothetical protein K8T06_13790, partial [bacterium]|nr:hypothetical protein [bacterium]
MPFILVPLIPFICSVVLLSLNGDTVKRWLMGLITISSNLIFISLVVWLVVHSNRLCPEEYLFSPLFHLPGTSEPLSFSFYIDSLSVLWLIILSFFSVVLNIFRLINKRNLHQQNHNLAAMQLAQSGLATLYLSGSLITSLIGWAIALAAILMSITDHKKASSKNDGIGFMILTLSVFFLLSSIFMIYGISGRLSFANSSTH